MVTHKYLDRVVQAILIHKHSPVLIVCRSLVLHSHQDTELGNTEPWLLGHMQGWDPVSFWSQHCHRVIIIILLFVCFCLDTLLKMCC
jgi:hypothetical protein